MSEYLKKTSYSAVIPLKKDRENLYSIKNKRAYLFKVRTKSLVSDLMILFTDYKQILSEGYVFEDQSRMDPRSLRQKRDKYLATY